MYLLLLVTLYWKPDVLWYSFSPLKSTLVFQSFFILKSDVFYIFHTVMFYLFEVLCTSVLSTTHCKILMLFMNICLIIVIKKLIGIYSYFVYFIHSICDIRTFNSNIKRKLTISDRILALSINQFYVSRTSNSLHSRSFPMQDCWAKHIVQVVPAAHCNSSCFLYALLCGCSLRQISV